MAAVCLALALLTGHGATETCRTVAEADPVRVEFDGVKCFATWSDASGPVEVDLVCYGATDYCEDGPAPSVACVIEHVEARAHVGGQ